jgi:hypothetical protein
MNTEEIFQQVMDENCKDPLHRFAELVAAAEREACADHYLGIMRDAVAQAVKREREACAKLCDDASLYFIDQGMNAVDGADYCANEIRGRTE